MTTNLFDFGINCTASADLYNALHGGASDSPMTLLRGLLRPGNNASDVFLQSQLESDSFTKDVSQQIGISCNDILCSSLLFTGNADIAGLGAIVAYASIAILSALFFLIGYRLDTRNTTTEYDLLVDTYFQGIMYFGMSAQIAFWAYLPKMETLYELTLGQLVTRLTACGIALTFWGMKRPFTALETALIPIGLLGSTALAIFSFFTSAYGKQRGFIDEPCEKVYFVPQVLIRVSASLYLFCALLAVIALGLSNRLDSIVAVSERIHFLGASIRGWLNILFAMTEFLLLWATLVLIIVVREQSKEIFGSSYGDNAMGYGQIMAIGFCIQTVCQAGEAIFNKLRHRSSEKSEVHSTKSGGIIFQWLKGWVQYRPKSVRDHHMRTRP